MAPAFIGFVSFASKTPAMIEAFLAENPDCTIGTTPLDRMIDKATGHDERVAQRFFDWCVDQFGRPEDLE